LTSTGPPRCTTASTTGGCSDPACCDAVCALRAAGLVWDVKTWRDGAPLRAGAWAAGVITLRDALEDYGATE